MIEKGISYTLEALRAAREDLIRDPDGTTPCNDDNINRAYSAIELINEMTGKVIKGEPLTIFELKCITEESVKACIVFAPIICDNKLSDETRDIIFPSFTTLLLRTALLDYEKFNSAQGNTALFNMMSVVDGAVANSLVDNFEDEAQQFALKASDETIGLRRRLMVLLENKSKDGGSAIAPPQRGTRGKRMTYRDKTLH